MAIRKRVWVDSPYHNYADRYAYKLSQSEIDQYKMYEENNVHVNYADDLHISCITIPTIDVFAIKPNYCVIYNGDTIESRWFVTEYSFVSGEQTSNKSKNTAALSRDVIVDFKDNIKQSITKIQQGNLPDSYSNLIVANEPVVLNKVKTGEVDILDEFGSVEWATVYYDNSEARTLQISPSGSEPPNLSVDTILNSTFFGSRVEDTGTSLEPKGNPSYKRQISKVGISATLEYKPAILSSRTVADIFYDVAITYNSSGVAIGTALMGVRVQRIYDDTPRSTVISEATNLYSSRVMTNFAGAGSKYTFLSVVNNIYSFDNSAVVDAETNQFNNRLVALTDNLNVETVVRTKVTKTTVENYINVITNDFSGYNQLGGEGPNTSGYRLYSFWVGGVGSGSAALLWNAVLNSTTAYTSLSLVLPAGKSLPDINCGCVTVPFGAVEVDGKTMGRETISRLMTSSITSAGTDLFYDVQILPYCPVRYVTSFYESGSITTSTAPSEASANIIPIKSGDDTVYNAFIVRENSGTAYLSVQNETLNPTTDLKKHTIADSVRFMSPNNASSFEMTPTRNYGITTIVLEWTIRPINPFYRISPSFSGMYGDNYQDSRGLFMEGGFSLSQVSSIWENYKLNNSTYRQVFDREVSSLELGNRVSRNKQQADLDFNLMSAQAQKDAALSKGLLGVGLGAVGGAVAGGKGGGIGVGIGAAGGAIGGIANLAISQNLAAEQIDITNRRGRTMIGLDNQLRSESVNYKKDLFRLSNQTMIAAPNTMIRGSDLTINNRGKAYIELYSCTPEEWLYLDSYLRLNGCTIERFGTLNQYLINDLDYIEASLIFTPGVLPHVSGVINAELSAGKFVQGGLFE